MSSLALLALGSTIAVEFLVYWVVLRTTPLRLFCYSVLINTLTLPLANFAYSSLSLNFYLIEGVVILSESFLLFLLLQKRYLLCLLLSLIANSITALISFLFLPF